MTQLEQIKSNIASKQEEVTKFMTANNYEEASKALDEIEILKKNYETAERADQMEKAMVLERANKGQGIVVETTKTVESSDNVKQFLDDMRTGQINTKSYGGQKEGTPGDGGYTVPKEISTKIMNFKEANFNLLQEVKVSTVKTNSGEKTYKIKGSRTGFTKTAEGVAVSAQKKLTFKRIPWSVDKYDGVYGATLEVLQDSDANLEAEIVNDAHEEFLVTGNKLVLDKIGKVASGGTDFKDLDGVSKAVLETLGQAYAAGVAIYTNDSGLLYLNNLKDSTNNYLLSVENNQPMERHLKFGAMVAPLKVLPNSVLANEDTKIPFIVADMKEYAEVEIREDMKVRTITEGTIGGVNAAEQDVVFYKMSARLGLTVIDENALVKGYIDPSAKAAE